MKMSSTGKHSKLIKNQEGYPVGLALALANGRWAPFDIQERRLVDISVSFTTPAKVLQFFRAVTA